LHEIVDVSLDLVISTESFAEWLAIDEEYQSILHYFIGRENQFFFYSENDYLLDIVSFVRSELLVLIELDPTFETRFTMESKLSLFFNISEIKREDFVSVVKYHTACPMAKILCNPLPPAPKGFLGNYLIWGGAVKKHLKTLFNVHEDMRVTDNVLRHAWSFLQGIKRGCNTVPKSYVSNSIVDHAKAMTTPPTHQMEWVPGQNFGTFRDPFEIFDSQLTRMFRSRQTVDLTTVQEPSHKASADRTIGEGGAYSEIVDLMTKNRKYTNYIQAQTPQGPIYFHFDMTNTSPYVENAVLSSIGYSYNKTYGLPRMVDIRDYASNRNKLSDFSKTVVVPVKSL